MVLKSKRLFCYCYGHHYETDAGVAPNAFLIASKLVAMSTDQPNSKDTRN